MRTNLFRIVQALMLVAILVSILALPVNAEVGNTVFLPVIFNGEQGIEPTPEPTFTLTPTQTPVPTSTYTLTPTGTRTPTQTPTNTVTPSRTQTLVPTSTHTPTRTWTPVPTQTFTPTQTATPSETPTATRTWTATPTRTFTATPTQTTAPTSTITPGGDQVIMQENFEGTWPNEDWTLFDYSGTGDKYLWGRRDCRSVSGSWSAWATGGGTNGSSLVCGSNYPYYVHSQAIYGPFSLVGATAAKLTFQIWISSETYYDYIFWGASKDDGDTFSGWEFSGDTQGWTTRELDLGNVPTIGSCLGLSEVYIEFLFTSDESYEYEGAYIDNLLLTKRTNGSPYAGSLLIGSQKKDLSPLTLKKGK